MESSVNLECLVIADDLTGACDAAVHFARAGHRVRVSLDADGGPCQTDVLALSTESRDAGLDVFRQTLAGRLRHLPELCPRILFKKIDSTLRGSVGPEVAEVLAAFACDVAIVTPAFPAMGRMVEGGCLRIAGGAHFAPVELAACFREHGVGPHCHAQAGAVGEAVASGARFVLLDAACEADLDAIVSQGLALPQRVLWAGSAGLAAALAWTGTGTPAAGRMPSAAPAREVAVPNGAAQDAGARDAAVAYAAAQGTPAAAIFCLGSDHAVTGATRPPDPPSLRGPVYRGNRRARSHPRRARTRPAGGSAHPGG
jgi:uncharacterized protein YgbK (DUF1537 family)